MLLNQAGMRPRRKVSITSENSGERDRLASVLRSPELADRPEQGRARVDAHARLGSR
jgi:hypothetical protein